MNRRRFVQIFGTSTLGLLAIPRWLRGQGTATADILVPADKGFTQEWLNSLADRGQPEVYRGDELKYIGMPVGGICAGHLYLGGDGKLWLWDIFNRTTMDKEATFEGRSFGNRDGATYVSPWIQKSPLAQGFAVKYQSGSISGQRLLSQDGAWEEITFEPKYPLAEVNYRDSTVPIEVKLEAFSPFVPLNFDDSSLPATVLRYTITNTGTSVAEVTLAGWLENVVLADSSPNDPVERQNQSITDVTGQGFCGSAQVDEPKDKGQPDIVFADFSDGTYNGWMATGDAFGSTPVARKDLPSYMHDIGGTGDYLVTSHNFRMAHGIEDADNRTGTLTSTEFQIERRFISFYSSGGNRPHEAGVRLLINGQPVLEQTGNDSNQLTERSWDVTKYLGQTAQIEIFDQAKGPWGNVHANNFVFSDQSKVDLPVSKRHDSGTLALYLIDAGPGITVIPSLPAGKPEDVVFNVSHLDSAAADRPIGSVQKTATLAPGESVTVPFVVGWNFPNIDPVINGPDMIHSYAVRFPDAGAVVKYVASHYNRLLGDTMNWVETWNDSTLPHWFLHRTFSNTCNLATNTSYRFANGQFWAWEGVYACEGTCTHVWGYTQAMGRIFPELERALREKTDYGFALHPDDGTIDYRGTHGGFAADGQAGIILRTYRDHLMTTDDTFVKPLWPKIKLAMDRLIRQVNAKGLLDGPQHNTLDTDWYGEVAWLSGLYLAALRAAEEMAIVCADADYAKKCRQLFETGSQSLVPELFNGEYFINKVDPNHLDAINSGTGCEIDQVMGQSWAWQVGLGRIFPQKETVTALRSVFRYNFAPDAGHYHELMKVGRWYAMPGESGLLVCTFPQADWDFTKAAGKGPEWAALYFNECQSGYEHEVASHLIAEGLVQEGLAVIRAVHDRYAPAKRNPFNEIECGDHYSRAMASYGSFITSCGYEYRGPDGYLSFAPRLTPEKFKAAFTSAQGWGSYAQESTAQAFVADLSLKWGQLSLSTLGVQPLRVLQEKQVMAQLDGQPVAATLNPKADRVDVTFSTPMKLKAGQNLKITLTILVCALLTWSIAGSGRAQGSNPGGIGPKAFIDYFLPTPIVGSLSKDVWGAATVGPRDTKNGLEDTTMKKWNYWDGKIIEGTDGKYYMFASRWDQANGHNGWGDSKAVEAVSDTMLGPYIDQGLVWPDNQGGKGHNVTALEMPDNGGYAVEVSETRNGDVFTSSAITGPFTQLGSIAVNGDKNWHGSNVSFMSRPDGGFEIIQRSGQVMTSQNILGPYTVRSGNIYQHLPGLPQNNLGSLEDPVIWYSGGLYHIVVNNWADRRAYHLISVNGLKDWKYQGVAYDPTKNFVRYTDGTVNHWNKMERPGVFIENGHVAAVSLACIDVPKEDEKGNDNHGSKIVVIPFDGAAMDKDLQSVLAPAFGTTAPQ